MRLKILIPTVFLMLLSCSFVLAANADVSISAPSEVQVNTPFDIDVSLNSNGEKVKAITLYVTGNNGKITFKSSSRSGEVWFGNEQPTSNKAVTINGQSVWLLDLGPFGSKYPDEKTNAPKKVLTITATASEADNIIIFEPNTQSKISKYPLGSITLNAVSPKAITIQQAPQCVDKDNDGYGQDCVKGPDCNDAEAKINPGAAEVCNNVDDNCDGKTDETFNKMTDKNNCGSCGNACGMDQSCSSGQCVPQQQQQDNKAILDAISKILQGQGTTLDKLSSIAAQLYNFFKS